MASPGGGDGPATLTLGSALRDLDISSDSDVSYDDSSIEEEEPNVCRWRTTAFHDQECSRYFDCPTHIVERAGPIADDNMSDNIEEPAPSSSTAETVRTNTQADASAGVVNDTSLDAAGVHEHLESAGQADEQEPEHTTQLPAPEVQHGTEGQGPSQDAEEVEITQVRHDEEGLLDTSQDTPQPPESASNNLNERPILAEGTDFARHNAHDIPDRRSSRPGPVQRRSSARSQGPTGLRRSGEGRPDSSDIVLPRWQPDVEVTLCPICRTQFSFFVRKHHCRKCGRVVCNACSPHRITIPYQYIVQQPDQPSISANRYPSSLFGDEYSDTLSIGGGERVRLCNPCVPDPNTAPPQAPTSPSQMSPRSSHTRSHSVMSNTLGGENPPSRFQGYFAPNPATEAFARHRSVTHSATGIPGSATRSVFSSHQNRILAGTPPIYYPSSSASAYPGGPQSHYRSMLDIGPSSSSSSRNRALPPPPHPPPQIPEEDECPICHRELPSSDLPNSEALRESHITTCIASHSAFGGGTPNESSADAPGAPSSPPFAPPRRSGMFPYVATEKDCIDSAECTICLEEFEAGVQMARLECLCRFHRSCISAWFVNHPGRCPVHQHDSFGY